MDIGVIRPFSRCMLESTVLIGISFKKPNPQPASNLALDCRQDKHSATVQNLSHSKTATAVRRGTNIPSGEVRGGQWLHKEGGWWYNVHACDGKHIQHTRARCSASRWTRSKRSILR